MSSVSDTFSKYRVESSSDLSSCEFDFSKYSESDTKSSERSDSYKETSFKSDSRHTYTFEKYRDSSDYTLSDSDSSYPVSNDYELSIHQTWKTNKLPSHLKHQAQSWRDKNPDVKYVFWDDDDCMDFIKEKYPEYLDTYNKLPLPVQRADFFRYLVIYEYGGVYSDIDTFCEKPIKEWGLKKDKLNICIEADVDNYTKINSRYAYNLQYCQWTFYAPKKHPTLLKVVERIKNKIDNGAKTIGYMDVLLLTGPGCFTEVINEELSNKRGLIHILDQEYFAWQDKLMGPKHKYNNICVIHTFEGSWKNNTSTGSNVSGIISGAIALAVIVFILIFVYFHSIKTC